MLGVRSDFVLRLAASEAEDHGAALQTFLSGRHERIPQELTDVLTVHASRLLRECAFRWREPDLHGLTARLGAKPTHQRVPPKMII